MRTIAKLGPAAATRASNEANQAIELAPPFYMARARGSVWRRALSVIFGLEHSLRC
jgi:hypothetical protein